MKNKKKNLLNIFNYIFIFVVLFVFFTSKVEAKEELFSCYYGGMDQASYTRVIVYDDYSNLAYVYKSTLKEYKKPNEEQVIGWSSFKDWVKETNSCVKYLTISDPFIWPLVVTGYNDANDAAKKCGNSCTVARLSAKLNPGEDYTQTGSAKTCTYNNGGYSLTIYTNGSYVFDNSNLTDKCAPITIKSDSKLSECPSYIYKSSECQNGSCSYSLSKNGVFGCDKTSGFALDGSGNKNTINKEEITELPDDIKNEIYNDDSTDDSNTEDLETNAETKSTDPLNFCEEDGVQKVFKMAGFIVDVIKILVPVLLIVLGSIDLAKAVISGDDKGMKSATNSLIKRVIAGVIIFFIPLIIETILGFIDGFNGVYNDSDLAKCKACFYNNCVIKVDKKPSEANKPSIKEEY